MNTFSFSLNKTGVHAIKAFSILAVCVVAVIVGGCDQRSQSSLVDIIRVAPLGAPPAKELLWSPVDQNQLLVSSGYANFSGGEIYVLNIKTGEKRVLARADYGSLAIRTWSSDGKNIIIAADKDTTGFEQGGLWEIAVEDTKLTFLQPESSRIIWGPNSTSLTVEKSIKTELGQEQTELVSIDRTTNKETRIFETDEQTILGFSWSPDAKKLVLSIGSIGLNAKFDIYVLDVQSGKVKQITEDGDNTYPVWSRKDDLIVYRKKTLEGNKEVFSLHLIDSNGVCDTKLHDSEYLLPPTWSPDGNSLAFIEPNANGIFIANLQNLLIGDYKEHCQ